MTIFLLALKKLTLKAYHRKQGFLHLHHVIYSFKARSLCSQKDTYCNAWRCTDCCLHSLHMLQRSRWICIPSGMRHSAREKESVLSAPLKKATYGAQDAAASSRSVWPSSLLTARGEIHLLQQPSWLCNSTTARVADPAPAPADLRLP